MNYFGKFLLKKLLPDTGGSKDRQQPLTSDLTANVNHIKEAFHYPANNALKVRDIYISSIQKDGTILFVDGAADTHTIERHIVQPLIEKSAIAMQDDHIAAAVLKTILSACSGKQITSLQEAVQDLLQGNTIVFINGVTSGLSLETPGFESRSVTEPKIENVLKGPKEAFVESIAINLSLIRRQIKDHNLMCETVKIGERVKNQVSVIYLKHVANPQLVEMVKQRLGQINSDTVQNLSILEQHIEERPYSLIPSVLSTERPDRTCSFLLEGHIILLMENSPCSLIVPITFWALFHTAEDQYQRWFYGNFMRIVRLLAVFVALLTPSLYIAVSTFHEEMLQTDLLLAIGATRERVPFPALMEVLLMEMAFELLREAGIRIPTVIGPTIGIVGALILGQAAVDANIISPILVIIVAITGLSSFAIPEISFNFGVRIFRFFILLSAAFMGFLGIALFLTALLAYMVSLKSFGVPFLAPMSPHYRSSKDLVLRPPVWKQWLRPYFTYPQDKTRRKKPEGNSSQ